MSINTSIIGDQRANHAPIAPSNIPLKNSQVPVRIESGRSWRSMLTTSTILKITAAFTAAVIIGAAAISSHTKNNRVFGEDGSCQRVITDRKELAHLIDEDFSVFKCASKELQLDRDFLLENIPKQCLSKEELEESGFGNLVLLREDRIVQNLNPELFADKQFMLSLGAMCPGIMSKSTQELRDDKEFMLISIKNGSLTLEDASPRLQADKDVVTAEFHRDRAPSGSLANKLLLYRHEGKRFGIEYASKELMGDKEFISQLARHDPFILLFAGENIKSDQQFILSVLQPPAGLILPNKEESFPETRDELMQNANQIIMEKSDYDYYQFYLLNEMGIDVRFILNALESLKPVGLDQKQQPPKNTAPYEAPPNKAGLIAEPAILDKKESTTEENEPEQDFFLTNKFPCSESKVIYEVFREYAREERKKLKAPLRPKLRA